MFELWTTLLSHQLKPPKGDAHNANHWLCRWLSDRQIEEQLFTMLINVRLQLPTTYQLPLPATFVSMCQALASASAIAWGANNAAVRGKHKKRKRAKRTGHRTRYASLQPFAAMSDWCLLLAISIVNAKLLLIFGCGQMHFFRID